MSRIGNSPIAIPEGVEVNLTAENVVNVKGKLGELSEAVDSQIKVNIAENQFSSYFFLKFLKIADEIYLN